MPFRNRLDAPDLCPPYFRCRCVFAAASLTHNARSLMTYEPHEIGVKEAIGC